MKKKTALITGICGQAGSFMADFLLEKDYEIVGIIRRNATNNLENAAHLENDIDIVEGDITDFSSMLKIIQSVRPHELYNFAAMSIHPDTYINLHQIGIGSYTRQVPIEELWNKKVIAGAKIESQKYTVENGEEIDIEVINTPKNRHLLTLGYKDGMGQWFPIKQVSRHWYTGKLIRLRQKWGEVIVTPNHSIYDNYGKLCSPISNPELLGMRRINYYNRSLKNEIELKIYDIGCDVVKDKDGWLIADKEKNKKIKVNLFTRDNSIQSFLAFCGAYISKGYVNHNKANGCFLIRICQNDRGWLEDLQEKLKDFYIGPSCIIKHSSNNCHELEISSRILYAIMNKYCGRYSENKQIPDFIFKLNHKYWNHLLKTLYEGNGSIDRYKNFENIRYSSSSKKLISTLCYIWSIFGIDYNYSHQIYNNKEGKEHWKNKYEIRQIRMYQNNNGNNEYEEINYDGYVYDISVDEVHNFCAGLGNIVVHNSHVHTSFEQPIATFNIDAIGPTNIIEAVKCLGYSTRIYQASSVTFDSPIVIRINGEIKFSTLEESYDIWNLKNFDTFEVLSCDNDGKIIFDKVKDVIDHGFKQVYEIDLFGKRKLKVTEDHSLIILDNGIFKETNIKKLKPNDKLITFCNNIDNENNEDIKMIYWKYKCSTKLKDIDNKHEYKEVTRSIPLNEKIAYLMGMYCAEGCISSVHNRRAEKMIFTFGNHEFDKNRPFETYKIIKKYFNYESSIRDRGSSTQVYVNKRAIFSLFKENIGINSHSKKVPNEILNSSYNIRLAFLNGYMGDAKITEKEISYTTVSKDLAIQINWMMRLMGIASKLTERYNKTHLSPQKTIIKDPTCYDIRISSLDNWTNNDIIEREPRCKCLSKEWFSDLKLSKNPSRKLLNKLGNNFGNSDIGMEKIKSITKLHIEQRVGDFSTENYERWFCGDVPILVHNTSELWGSSPPPQNEETIMRPQSPYAIAKLAAHWMGKLYREAYKMYICCGITHNFESERRGPNFVTRKISLGVAKVLKDPTFKLKLGNLDAKRDWTYCFDMVRAWWLMLQQEKPDDYVLASGEMHSVKEFCELAFAHVGLNWEDHVEIDRFFMRPAEVEELCGDYSKAKEKLNWEPTVSFEKLVEIMVDHDCKLLGVKSIV